MEKNLKGKVDPKSSALIVVDVQNDFCHPEGAFAKKGVETKHMAAIAPALNRLIAGAKKAGAPVIYIKTEHSRWTNSPAWLERSTEKAGPPVCVRGTWGTDFFKVQPKDDDYIVIKHRYSAFQDTDLDCILRSLDIKTLIMTGVATNVCVESTARHGLMKNYKIVFVSDCAGTATIEEHEASLYNMKTYFGTVASSEEIIKAWK